MPKMQSLYRKRSVWLTIILGLLLIGGLFLGYGVFPASTATILLKPAIRHFSDTQTVYFRPAGGEKNKDAVDTTVLTATLFQDKEVPATGKSVVEATHARGRVILSRFEDNERLEEFPVQSLNIKARDGTLFITDGFTSTEGAPVIVNVVAAVAGEQGNVPAHYFDGIYPIPYAVFAPTLPPFGSIYIENFEPFTGGKDGSSFTTVQQKDIEEVAKSIEKALIPATTSSLQKQFTGGKHMVPASLIECNTTSASNPRVGEPATTISVKVVVTCFAHFYDEKNVLTTTTKLQQLELEKLYGPGYIPHGKPEIHYVQSGARYFTRDGDLKVYSTITLIRSGNWIYSVNLQWMAQNFAGKPLWWVNRELEAMDNLLSHSVASSGFGGALPFSPGNIKIEVRA